MNNRLHARLAGNQIQRLASSIHVSHGMYGKEQELNYSSLVSGYPNMVANPVGEFIKTNLSKVSRAWTIVKIITFHNQTNSMVTETIEGVCDDVKPKALKGLQSLWEIYNDNHEQTKGVEGQESPLPISWAYYAIPCKSIDLLKHATAIDKLLAGSEYFSVKKSLSVKDKNPLKEYKLNPM